ncbi:hypothetical protein ACIRPU_33790 [Streptomyces sp. NPDC102259]|uniref:hypothetical protein n=1 Tax=unclassified Streptomyces TaxID=2593676 RepID=UPI0033B1C7E6
MTGREATEYDELDDDIDDWAGPPRGCYHPKKEDVPEDQALPPEGPPGVSATADRPAE